MATVAAVAAAAASVAAAGINAASQSGAFGGGGASGKVGTPKQVPLPGYADATNRIVARDTVMNMNRTPPTFAEWLKSGGTATFGMKPTGMTPSEAQKLGIVDRSGNPIPQFETSQFGKSLTTEQKMYLGELLNRREWTKYATEGQDPLSAFWRRQTGKTGEPQWVIDMLKHRAEKSGNMILDVFSGGMHNVIGSGAPGSYTPPKQKKAKNPAPTGEKQ